MFIKLTQVITFGNSNTPDRVVEVLLNKEAIMEVRLAGKYVSISCNRGILYVTDSFDSIVEKLGV